MDNIEKKENDIVTLRGKYERDKIIMASHGISSSEGSGGMSIFGQSSGSRRRPRLDEAESSGSSA